MGGGEGKVGVGVRVGARGRVRRTALRVLSDELGSDSPGLGLGLGLGLGFVCRRRGRSRTRRGEASRSRG